VDKTLSEIFLTDRSGTRRNMPMVLFVDDDNAFWKELRRLFDQGSDFDACEEARNGAEALAKTRGQSPDLAILDLSLPDMSGLQLAGELKEIMPELPIFLLTTDYSVKLEKQALSCGIIAVFSKLDDLAMLLANARAVCRIE
jgi:DNA-binding NarL/FixJ family response regulator